MDPCAEIDDSDMGTFIPLRKVYLSPQRVLSSSMKQPPYMKQTLPHGRLVFDTDDSPGAHSLRQNHRRELTGFTILDPSRDFFLQAPVAAPFPDSLEFTVGHEVSLVLAAPWLGWR